MKKVSVIIPVYNREEWIHIPIESLKTQSFTDFEVLIINDGSSDQTEYRVSELTTGDSRFQLIHQQNSGVSAARNTGIRHSTGTYICFLDSDDYYHPDFLLRMVQQLEQSAAEVCYSGYKIKTPSSERIKRTVFTNSDVLTNYLMGKVNISTQGWMIAARILKAKGIYFREGMSWGEDVDFFCRVLSEAPVVTFVSDYLSYYRVAYDSEQLSNFDVTKLDYEYATALRLADIFVNKGLNTEYKALSHYRLPALMVYGLRLAIQRGQEPQVVKKYYDEYKTVIDSIQPINGMRSIKLLLAKKRLERQVYRLKNKGESKWSH